VFDLFRRKIIEIVVDIFGNLDFLRCISLTFESTTVDNLEQLLNIVYSLSTWKGINERFWTKELIKGQYSPAVSTFMDKIVMAHDTQHNTGDIMNFVNSCL